MASRCSANESSASCTIAATRLRRSASALASASATRSNCRGAGAASVHSIGLCVFFVAQPDLLTLAWAQFAEYCQIISSRKRGSSAVKRGSSEILREVAIVVLFGNLRASWGQGLGGGLLGAAPAAAGFGSGVHEEQAAREGAASRDAL